MMHSLRYLWLITFFTAPFLSLSQDLSLGIQGGLNKTYLSADSTINNYSLSHRTFGFVMEYVGTSIWGFQLELNYNEKGGGKSFIINDTLIDVKLKLKYIELPMMVKVIIGGEKIYGSGYAGLSLAYGQTVSEKYSVGAREIIESGSFKDFHFSNIEMGILGGFDLNVAINHIIIFGDLRVTKGFTSVFEAIEGVYTNKSTQIKVGIKYRF